MSSSNLLSSLSGQAKSPKGKGISSGIKMPKVSRRMFRIALKRGGKAGLSGTIPSRSSLKGV